MNTAIGDVKAWVETAHNNWGWFLVLGLCLIALGAVAIVYEGLATLASITALGVILIIAGIVQLVTAFQARNFGHVVLYLVFGVLELFVGFGLLQHPLAGTLTVTLVLAVYLMFTGIFRIVYSVWAQFPQWGWAVLSGVVAVLLGLMLYVQWPSTALWFIGLAVGVNLIFAGISWTGLAMRLKAI